MKHPCHRGCDSDDRKKERKQADGQHEVKRSLPWEEPRDRRLLLSAAQPNATYGWSTGSASATISVTTAGTYGVTVDLNGCLASDAITVSVFDPADLDLGPDLTLCPGESVALSASMDGEFLWSTWSAANAITVSSTGTYWLNVSQAACIATDTVNVYVVPLIAPDLGSSVHLCEGDSAVVGVEPGGAEVAWSTGSTSDSITVTSSGTYSVELSLMGCIATDANLVTATLLLLGLASETSCIIS